MAALADINVDGIVALIDLTRGRNADMSKIHDFLAGKITEEFRVAALRTMIEGPNGLEERMVGTNSIKKVFHKVGAIREVGSRQKIGSEDLSVSRIMRWAAPVLAVVKRGKMGGNWPFKDLYTNPKSDFICPVSAMYCIQMWATKEWRSDYFAAMVGLDKAIKARFQGQPGVKRTQIHVRALKLVGVTADLSSLDEAKVRDYSDNMGPINTASIDHAKYGAVLGVLKVV